MLLVTQKKAVLYRRSVPNWFGVTNVVKPKKRQNSSISTITDLILNNYDRDGSINKTGLEIELYKIAYTMAKIQHVVDEKQYVFELEEKWSKFFITIDTILHVTFQLIHLVGVLLILLL